MRYFIFFILFILLLACNEEKIKPKVVDEVSSEELPDQESKDAVITFTEEGKIKAILYSKNIKVISNSREKLLTDMKIEFFNEEESKTSELVALRGRIDDATQDMYAIDSVVAINDSGVVLTTDELIWKNKTKKIVTDKFVRIENNEEIIEGYGFESDQNLQNYTIFNITYVTTLDENEK